MNVLFVTADQWRGDCLSCLGHPAVRTPNLDRLAADGGAVRAAFRAGHAVRPVAGLAAHRPLCAEPPLDHQRHAFGCAAQDPGQPGPRGRLRSGPVRLHRHQRRPAHPAGGQPLAAHLRGRGAGLSGRAAAARGGGGLSRPSGRARLWPADLRRRSMAAASARPAPFRAEDSVTAFLADRFLGWLDRQGGEPWFAHVSFLKPHPPFVAPEPWYSAVSPGDVPPPVRAATPEAEGALHPWLAAHLAQPIAGQDRRGAARRGQPRAVAGGLFRADRRGRPSSRPHPRAAGTARRAGADSGRGHRRTMARCWATTGCSARRASSRRRSTSRC